MANDRRGFISDTAKIIAASAIPGFAKNAGAQQLLKKLLQAIR